MNFKRLLSLTAIAVIGIINILIYCNSHFYYRAKEKIEDSEKKIKTLERANLFYPSNDLVFYELGKAYFDVGIRNLYDKDRSHAFLQKSIQNFTRSLRINPASYFCHFDLAQSLLYISYLSPDFDANYYDEYKKAALLAGHDSQIYYEVGRILLSHWPALSEEDKDFTLEILREILKRKEREKLQAVMQIWEMNVKDYEVMERILPEDAGIYRMYAKFIGEKNLSCEERQRILVEAELLEFERAKDEYHSGEREFRYYRLKEAFNHFTASLRILERINFYQNLAGRNPINVEEFNNLKKSACLNLVKCRLEEGRELKEVEGTLRRYLALENAVAVVGELESYLRRQDLIEEKLGASLSDLGHLSFQMLLYFKQNRYRDIMRVGRLLNQSFVVVPEEKKDAYVRVLHLVGDSFQKVDYIYDAGEIYQKALEIYPDNLGTLLRIRQNYERLNEEEKIQQIDEKIEKLLAPREVRLKNSAINKGRSFARTLTLDGKTIVLDFHFKKDKEESGFVPLISVFFNGYVVWEDYLKENVISISLKSKIGKNTLVVAPVNRSVDLLKISYRATGS